MGILSKVKVYLNTSALCSLYYALFHCHIQYGIITWSSTYKTYLKKLATLQNKAVKIVGNGTWNDRATPYYAKLKILKLQDLVKLETAAFVYNYKSGQLPPTFQNYFTALNNIHVKGGESSSHFRWFAIAKIELQFLIFFVLILGLRLQRYSTNTKRCPPEKSFWKL